MIPKKEREAKEKRKTQTKEKDKLIREKPAQMGDRDRRVRADPKTGGKEGTMKLPDERLAFVRTAKGYPHPEDRGRRRSKRIQRSAQQQQPHTKKRTKKRENQTKKKLTIKSRDRQKLLSLVRPFSKSHVHNTAEFPQSKTSVEN